MKNRNFVPHVFVFTVLTLVISPMAAADTPLATSMRKLHNATNEGQVVIQREGEYVSHLRALSNPVPESSSHSPEARARMFFSTYRDLFLAANTPLDMNTVRVSAADAAGTSHVRFQQSYKGIPVRGGEAIVHLNAIGVTSVQSKLLADLSNINTTPRITAADAIAAVRTAINYQHNKTTASLSVPQLEIINADRLHGKQYGETRLAWLIEVTGGPDVSIWVDAHSGRVILQVNRIAHVMARDVEDFRGNCTADINSGNSDSYIDGGSIPTSGDALAAWNNAKTIYDYFLTLGRDGLDGTDGSNGYTGRGTFIVNVCNSDFVRPSSSSQEETTAWDRIALWDRSVPDSMKFSTGTAAADDVIAHEYTHALAAYMMPGADTKPAGFLLTGQSGALAEAFADIFGQAIDLSKNDDPIGSSTRWTIGEATTGGSFRNLMTPNDYNQPGKITDSTYYCGADDDIAIHTNGSVLGHAFALAVDGSNGTYNGVTVNGIGLDKAARVFYKALDEYMLPTSTYASAYSALLDAAEALFGLGSAERDSIKNALNAVELQVNPCSSGKASYCPAGQVKTNLFADDFENPASGNWTNSVNMGVNHWNLGSNVSGIYRPNAADASITSSESKPLSGNYALWADNLHKAGDSLFGDSVVTMTNAFSVPEHGNVHLQFEHKFDFETYNDLEIPDPDGGVIEYSIAGGDWTNAKDLIRDGRNMLNSISSGGSPLKNQLAGNMAFVGNTFSLVTNKLEYVSTQLDLSTLAGMSVKFRFRMGTDTFAVGKAGGGLGWMIDDVAIYTCSQVIATPATGLQLSENGGQVTFTVQLTTAVSSSKHVTLTLSSTKDTEGTVSPTELTFNESNWNIPQTVTVTSVDDSDVDGTQKFSVKIALETSTDDPGYTNMPDTYVSLTNTDNDVKRKRKGGAWDVFSILLMVGLLWATRQQRCVNARHTS